MKPESARAFACVSAIFILVGLLVMSPSGAFASFGIAALLVIAPAAFGKKRVRVVSILLLIGSLVLAISYYPAYERERNRLKQHQKEGAAVTTKTTEFTWPEPPTHPSPSRGCIVIESG